jgi:hypothetical protein
LLLPARFYRDPAGYRIEIQRFDDEDWARR